MKENRSGQSTGLIVLYKRNGEGRNTMGNRGKVAKGGRIEDQSGKRKGSGKVCGHEGESQKRSWVRNKPS